MRTVKRLKIGLCLPGMWQPLLAQALAYAIVVNVGYREGPLHYRTGGLGVLVSRQSEISQLKYISTQPLCFENLVHSDLLRSVSNFLLIIFNDTWHNVRKWARIVYPEDSITGFALCCAADREAACLSAARATDQSMLLGGSLQPTICYHPKKEQSQR